MNVRHLRILAASTLLALSASPGRAQTVYSEDFTQTATTNSWYFFNGACLTAGTSTSTSSPGIPPACTAILPTYYALQTDADPALVGGALGYLGSSTPPANLSAQVPDPPGNGALRFTNGHPYGNNERGAIISASTFDTGQGIEVTFKTISYHGDSGGTGDDGADGMSFFLVNGTATPGLGSFGGSLGYTCSNTNDNYDGMNGAYVAVGMDEYGNFLNGTNLVAGYTGANKASGDNTAYGYGYKPDRIGMRGAGSVSWTALNTAYGTNPGSTSMPYYPSSLYGACSSGTYYSGNNMCGSCSSGGTFSTATGTCSKGSVSWSATKAESAVQNTCANGTLYNYKTFSSPTSAGATLLTNSVNTAGILDYAPIPNAYKELNGFEIAAEGATTRAQATPIFYDLKITQNGLLSLSYSIAGGAYVSVIKGQSITASNGPLPATFRFGFAGSTGGSTNVHEIMCFKAAPAVQSGSSATVNEKQSAKVEAGTQAYFAYYNPANWTGTVTANNLIDTGGVITVATTANWDAQCVLTGTAAGAPSAGGGCVNTNASGPTAATPAPTSRVMLTWDTVNLVGIPFEWANINSTQQATLDFGDSTQTAYRLNYLRGDRSNEINSSGVGLYRARDGVLGDLVDSSPIWIGPPDLPWPTVWRDQLDAGAPLPENNSGAQSYAQFTAAEATRLNVVYVGANDGFLHGFRAGSFDVNGNFVANSTTPNDGQEVVAYMPGSTLVSNPWPSAPGGCLDTIPTTGTMVQNIHGWSPAIGTNVACVNPLLDYANSQYGHNFFVDATPGSGDLFFGGSWHTWIVSGLGVGGAAIFAIDVTNPGSSFSESNASSLVIGEWNPSTINCANVSNCGLNMGNTFGTPQIRRLHNGDWAAIFGNGFGSQTGDAGIYVMTVNSTTGAQTFYYLSTQSSGSSDGIAYTTPVDLDGDHITDYVYAGDLLGNVWRFDLTSTNPSQWGVTNSSGISINNGGGSPTPLFTTPTGQPITTQLLAIQAVTGGASRLLIEFGTGQRTQITNIGPAQYASGTQALYGVWDWNLSQWNSMSTTQYASLAPKATGLSSPYTLGYLNLTQQTLSAPDSNGVVAGTNVIVCWQGTSTCSGSNTSFGWYANLPSSGEQIIYNPVFYQGAFVVNSTVPANNIPTSCTVTLDSGYTYALSVVNGGVFTNAFQTYTKNGTLVTETNEAGVNTNATGSVYVVTTAQQTSNIVYQTIAGAPGSQEISLPSNTKAKRLTWVEKR